jgi:ribonuclease P protein component
MNKEKIIKKSETYSEIISEKKSYKSKYFSVYYKKTNENNKYGITVPKKVGKAHIRNKLKRQIKNIIITNEKDIQTGFNYVIIIKEASLELSYQELSYEILSLLKKVRN